MKEPIRMKPTLPLAALLALTSLTACISTNKPVTGTASLQIDVIAPTDPGSQTTRLDGNSAAARAITVNITAMNEDGSVDTTFNNDLQVYVQYLGTLTPYLCGSVNTTGSGGPIPCTPLATVKMLNGKATGQTITLPPVFGPTELWFDDGADATPTFATGTTTTLWYRDPFIADIQHPTTETDEATALDISALDNKNVGVNGSRYGSDGRLVVTSVFAQGYTLADVKCAPGGVAPCVGSNYDYLEVFSYSAPLDDSGNVVKEGETITGFAGGVSDFDGLTELGFPQTFTTFGEATPPTVDKSLEPAPWVFDNSWLTFDSSGMDDTKNMINFERAEGAALEVDNVTVCPLDPDYTTYKQWKLAPPGSDCMNDKTLINVISEGVIPLDPSLCVGQKFPRIVGMLRPVNIGTFNVWLIYPRSTDDISLPSSGSNGSGDSQCTFTSGN